MDVSNAVPQPDGDGRTCKVGRLDTAVMDMVDRMPPGEIRVIDPVTGGAKGSKREDYSQIPPIPLLHTLNILQEFKEWDPGRVAPTVRESWTNFLTEGDRGWLAVAAARATRAMSDPLLYRPAVGLDAVARVYRNGALKYADANWCLGYSWRLTIASGWRHLVRYEAGEIDNMEEIKGQLFTEPHLAHFVWHCFTLYEFDRLKRGTNDHLFFKDSYGKPRAA